MFEKILIADDEVHIREGLKDALLKENYIIDLSHNGIDALSKIKQTQYDVLLTDIRMPGMNGLDLLEQTKIYSPDTEVVLMTAYGTIEDAVCAIKNNAYDYISKPIDIKKLRILVKETLNHKNNLKENLLDNLYTNTGIIGESSNIMEVLSIVKKVAPSDATVLIQGESGTGKEVIAHEIHYNSQQKDKSFIIVNCGAIPEALLESELFGHEKGAFTSAISKQIGKFELANNGTLFLDEISTLSLKSQVNLLRVLEEQSITRLGGNEKIKIKVRIIAASNIQLDELVAEGKFREDLFYRLNVVPICLPPLRERQRDIPLLTDKFLIFFCDKHKKLIKKISKDAMEYMLNYQWPGNIRELKNIVERLVVIISEDIIDVPNLPANIIIRKHSSQIPSNQNELPELTIENMEKELIKNTLTKLFGNRENTAKALGIGARTLYYKLKQYGIK